MISRRAARKMLGGQSRPIAPPTGDFVAKRLDSFGTYEFRVCSPGWREGPLFESRRVSASR